MIGIISAIVSVCYNLLFNEIDERNLSDKERLERKSKKKKKLKLPAVVGVIINVIVVIIGWLDYVSLVINRNDMIYYGLMCVSFAIGIAMIAKSVMSLNQLSTRKLPQYNYEGGNTNA
jgi:hypothetical protein